MRETSSAHVRIGCWEQASAEQREAAQRLRDPLDIALPGWNAA